jgi:RND family efflux transporter MFP subunit
MTGNSDASARRRTRRTRITLVGAGWLALVLLLTCGACKSDYPAGASQAQTGGATGEARQVHTARVAELPVGNTISVTGQLAAQDQATLSVKVPGRLRNVTVDLGSVVRQRQTVAQIEQQDYQLRVQQAEAALGQARARLGLAPEGTDDKVEAEQTGTVRQARAVMDEARTTRERTDTLVKQGVVSRAEWDAADAAYKVAVSRFQDAVEEIRNRQALLSQRRAELALARQQLTDTTVVAPFDGIVQERKASAGEYLAAGAAIVTVVRVNPLRFRAEVPERDAASVKMGQRVNVTVEGAPQVYGGHVVRLSPSISEQNRVLIVEAEVSNNGTLRPGSFARADIITSDTSKAVTVPTNAIITFAGIEKVIVVQNGKALEKPITTGRRGDNWTEVVAGVNVGDAVVLDPGNLQSGQAVNVVE